MAFYDSKSRLIISLLAFFLVVGCFGCGESVEGPDTSIYEQRTPQPLNTKVFVNVDEFEQLRAEGAAVLDARSFPEYEGIDDRDNPRHRRARRDRIDLSRFSPRRTETQRS